MKPAPTCRETELDTSGARRVLDRCADLERKSWSIVLVILIAVSTGFTLLVLASLVRARPGPWPQWAPLLVGFASLIILLNAYIISQRRALTRTRAALLEQMARVERAVAASFIDPLTGLFNRRYLDYFTNREAQRINRAGGGFTLLMVDVNGFKSVNDRHGHVEGDRFLQEVGKVLKQTFRESDTIMRYGGDEFVVLMPDTSEQNAPRVLERLQQAVAGWNRTARFQGLTMNLSCGVAGYTKGSEIEAVLALADQRMYDHKSSLAAGVGRY